MRDHKKESSFDRETYTEASALQAILSQSGLMLEKRVNQPNNLGFSAVYVLARELRRRGPPIAPPSPWRSRVLVAVAITVVALTLGGVNAAALLWVLR
jgi:hypothetical protein